MPSPRHPGPDLADLRLRPGTPVLDRGGGQVQLGTDDRWALVVDGLSDAEARWLHHAASTRHVGLAASAGRHDVSADRQDRIARLLADCGFLVPPPATRLDVTATAAGAADAAALGALRPDGAGQVTLARRAVRTVGVSGLGRLGASLVTHLAAAGVGTLLLDDTAPVQVTDLGAGPYRQTDVGGRRADRLHAALAEHRPRTRIRTVWPADATPDVVVVVRDHVVGIETSARLMSAGVPHLAVTVVEAGIELGPFVLPGTTACLGCRHRRAADDDDAWPRLADQLRAWPGPAPQETVLAATAAALAAGMVTAHLDGTRPVAADRLIHVRLPDAVPRLRDLPPHPRCGCTADDGPAAGARADPGAGARTDPAAGARATSRGATT